MYLQTSISSFIIVVLSRSLVQAAYEHSCPPEAYSERSATRVYACGTRLQRLLRRKCPNGIYVEAKRVPGQQNQAPVHAPPFFITKNEANQMLTSRKRTSRQEQQGIACECCVHRCSVQEMEQYCKPDEGRKKRGARPILLNSREHMLSGLTQQDLDYFYESLEKMNEPVDEETQMNATIQLIRFNSSPAVRALLKNKVINSMLEERQQASSEEKRNKAEDIPNVALKNYIKTHLADLLADKDIVPAPSTDSNIIPTRHQWSPEARRLLYRLLSET